MPITLRPGHGGDAHRGDGQAAGNVVGQPDHPRAADAGRRLQLIERDHRAGTDLDDLALHAVIRQHRFQQARIGLQRLLAGRADAGPRRRGREQRQRRELPRPFQFEAFLMRRRRPADRPGNLGPRRRRHRLGRLGRRSRHRDAGLAARGLRFWFLVDLGHDWLLVTIQAPDHTNAEQADVAKRSAEQPGGVAPMCDRPPRHPTGRAPFPGGQPQRQQHQDDGQRRAQQPNCDPAIGTEHLASGGQCVVRHQPPAGPAQSGRPRPRQLHAMRARDPRQDGTGHRQGGEQRRQTEGQPAAAAMQPDPPRPGQQRKSRQYAGKPESLQ